MSRLEIMREAIATSGKPVNHMLDVKEHWTPKQAIRRVHTIEEAFDLTWTEEPARQ
jgi:L-alanine-DL-glutamate epimerase-like enolase superfamily enzyme